MKCNGEKDLGTCEKVQEHPCAWVERVISGDEDDDDEQCSLSIEQDDEKHFWICIARKGEGSNQSQWRQQRFNLVVPSFAEKVLPLVKNKCSRSNPCSLENGQVQIYKEGQVPDC